MTPRTTQTEPSPHWLAIRLSAAYAVVGGLWIVFSDWVLVALRLPIEMERNIASAKGGIYVVVTSLALYVLALGMLRSLRAARDQVRDQEHRIREAYVDVIDAATGGKLVLLTSEEMRSLLGTPLTQTRTLDAEQDMSEARDFVRRILAGSLGNGDVESAVLAFGEAVTNALKYAGPADYQVRLGDDGTVQVVVSDRGPGIDFTTLPKAALVPGFSTARTLGMGFTIMLQTTARVLIQTSEDGTTLALEFK